MMTTVKNGQIVSVPKRRVPGMGGVLQTVIEKAPMMYDLGKKGVEAAAAAGKFLQGTRRRGGYAVPSRGGAPPNQNKEKGEQKRDAIVEPSRNTISENRSSAPVSLALNFNGPEYKFSKCNYQGMEGLRVESTILWCSIEQNTTTTLRGLVRNIANAGAGGDVNMLASTFSPVGSYIPATLAGRVSTSLTVLYAIAAPFRKYRVTKGQLKFESELSTATTGGLAIAVTSDPADVLLPAMTATTAAQYACSLLTTVWDDAYLDFTLALNKDLMNMNPEGANIASLQQNIASPCAISVVADQSLPANTVVGKLFLHSVVELYNPGPLPSTFAETILKESSALEAKELEMYADYKRTAELQKEKDEEEEKELALLDTVSIKSGVENFEKRVPSAPKKDSGKSYFGL